MNKEEMHSLRPSPGKVIYVYFVFGGLDWDELDGLDEAIGRAWWEAESHTAAPVQIVASDGEGFYTLDRKAIEEQFELRGYE